MPTVLTTKFKVPASLNPLFADWQAKLNAAIAAFPGFVSLEILSPRAPSDLEWAIIQRFSHKTQVEAWRQSKKRLELVDELEKLLGGLDSLQEAELEVKDLQGGITEVFITEVSPDKEGVFREWIARIHQAEAKFPGFKGVYVQSPAAGQGKNWITLLQFDSSENLDRWLASPERQQVLNESRPFAYIESHRMASSYAGWFSSIAKRGELPPVWKQTMIVLLALFPIVMIELKYLSPLTQGFGASFSTFVGNAISVSLISWPMMPIAIWFLGWWLSPETNKRRKTVLGTLVVVTLYLLEVVAFWQFL